VRKPARDKISKKKHMEATPCTTFNGQMTRNRSIKLQQDWEGRRRPRDRRAGKGSSWGADLQETVPKKTARGLVRRNDYNPKRQVEKKGRRRAQEGSNRGEKECPRRAKILRQGGLARLLRDRRPRKGRGGGGRVAKEALGSGAARSGRLESEDHHGSTART